MARHTQGFVKLLFTVIFYFQLVGYVSASPPTEIGLKYSSVDCITCSAQIIKLLRQFPTIPIYYRSKDELEIKKFLSNFNGVIKIESPIKMIESGSSLDNEVNGGVFIRDNFSDRLILFKKFNELSLTDLQVIELFYNDLGRTIKEVGKGKIKHKGDVYFDNIIEVSSENFALVQNNGWCNLFNLKKRKITSTIHLLSDSIVMALYEKEYGKNYVERLQRDSATQNIIKQVPYSLSDFIRINGKFHGLFKFLHVKDFDSLSLEYGLMLLTINDDFSAVTNSVLLDIEKYKFLPYSVSLTEKEDLLFVHYENEKYQDSLFYKISINDTISYEPFYSINIKLDSIQSNFRGISLGNSFYTNGYVSYCIFPVISTREKKFDFSELVNAINTPNKNVPKGLELNGFVFDDNSFTQVRLKVFENEIVSRFRRNDFLFKLRIRKSDFKPLGISCLHLPDGYGVNLSNGNEMYINPKTLEYKIIQF